MKHALPLIRPTPSLLHTHKHRRLATLSYNLGGFRVDSHKMQVYDHCSRVPFVVWGPELRAPPPLGLDIPTSFYDLAPTILEVFEEAVRKGCNSQQARDSEMREKRNWGGEAGPGWAVTL